VRNISKEFVEKIKTHFFNKVLIFFSENHVVYEIMWKNAVDPDRLQTTTRRMRMACWIPKATKTHSEYVILIAFPLQQWLHERASVLLYTYIARVLFVINYLSFVRSITQYALLAFVGCVMGCVGEVTVTHNFPLGICFFVY
jgi:hypothetical protein